MIKTDGRYSFVTGSPARVYGIKAGLSFNSRVYIGLSYNWLGKGVRRELPLSSNETVVADLRYSSVAPFFEFIFYRKNHISVSVPTQLGFGYIAHRYNSSNGDVIVANRGFVLMYEPAMTIEHTFLKYFALGAGIGYRLVLIGNKAVEDRLNSPTYLIRFKLDFKALYGDIRGKDRD
jgi:hypothetical protein